LLWQVITGFILFKIQLLLVIKGGNT